MHEPTILTEIKHLVVNSTVECFCNHLKDMETRDTLGHTVTHALFYKLHLRYGPPPLQDIASRISMKNRKFSTAEKI